MCCDGLSVVGCFLLFDVGCLICCAFLKSQHGPLGVAMYCGSGATFSRVSSCGCAVRIRTAAYSPLARRGLALAFTLLGAPCFCPSPEFTPTSVTKADTRKVLDSNLRNSRFLVCARLLLVSALRKERPQSYVWKNQDNVDDNVVSRYTAV